MKNPDALPRRAPGFNWKNPSDQWVLPEHEYRVVEKGGKFFVRNDTARQTLDAIHDTKAEAEATIEKIKTVVEEPKKPTLTDAHRAAKLIPGLS